MGLSYQRDLVVVASSFDGAQLWGWRLGLRDEN
jgi:hypothetical protein